MAHVAFATAIREIEENYLVRNKKENGFCSRIRFEVDLILFDERFLSTTAATATRVS